MDGKNNLLKEISISKSYKSKPENRNRNRVIWRNFVSINNLKINKNGKYEFSVQDKYQL